jgi:hypothetical protein
MLAQLTPFRGNFLAVAASLVVMVLLASYSFVALMWLVPDRRIERIVADKKI